MDDVIPMHRYMIKPVYFTPVKGLAKNRLYLIYDLEHPRYSHPDSEDVELLPNHVLLGDLSSMEHIHKWFAAMEIKDSEVRVLDPTVMGWKKAQRFFIYAEDPKLLG